MKKHLIWLTAILSITLVGCNKEETGPQTGASGSSGNYPSFTGYTSTDNNGMLTAYYDSTDWENDTNWISVEENLFPEFPNLVSDFEAYSSVGIFPAYPNPTSSATYFQLSKESNVRFSYRVVNKNFITIASSDSVYNNSFGLNTMNVVSPTDTMVRVYYFFERNDSCLYKGHGDLKIN